MERFHRIGNSHSDVLIERTLGGALLQTRQTLIKERFPSINLTPTLNREELYKLALIH